MGKQRRRKRVAQAGDASRSSTTINGNKRKLQDSLLLLNSGTSSLDRTCSKNSAIVGKIGHFDARVRDATLSALSVTLLSNSDNGRRLPNDILRALSERVVADTDLSCVVAAAGCLLNYVQSSDEHCTQLVEACSTTFHVLLSRIARALQNMKNATAKGASPSSHIITMEYRTIHVALQVLVTMLESGNDSCLEAIVSSSEDRSSSSSSRSDSYYYYDVAVEGDDDADTTSTMSSTSRKMTALELLFYTFAFSTATSSSLLLGLLHPLTLNTDGSSNHNSSKAGNVDENLLLYTSVSGSVETSARIVHSTLDAVTTGAEVKRILNTTTTVVRVPSSTTTTDSNPVGTTTSSYHDETNHSISARKFLQYLLELNNSDSILSSKARLHIAGALTIALRSSKQDDEETTELLSCFVNTILPLLSNHLDKYDDDCYQNSTSGTCSSLIENVIKAYTRLQQEQMDEKLERSVTEKQQEEKESARAIARRLYNHKKNAVNGNNQGASTATSATVDTAAISTSTEEQKLNTELDKQLEKEEKQNNTSMEVENSDDVQGAYEQAVDAWTSFMFSLSLTLEISTNMTAVTNNSDLIEPPYDVNVPMEWESDGEDDKMEELEIVNKNGATSSGYEVINDDSCLYLNLILQSLLPSRVLSLMDRVTRTINYLIARTWTSSECTTTTTAPHVIFQDLFQVQSKCGACLGNMAANLHTWRKEEQESHQIWIALLDALRCATDYAASSDTKNTSNYGSSASSASACSLSRALVSMLRSRRNSILPAVTEKDLNFLLSLLRRSNNSYSTDEEETRQNVVVIIGIIGMESHTEQVHSLISRALLKSMEQKEASVLVQGEILNVLMDIYANDDDACNAVFKNEGALSKFQKILPSFRQRITKEAKNISPEAQMNLREIALNASRFIKYKMNYS